MAIPRVNKTPTADYCVAQIAMNLITPRFTVKSPAISSSAARPNYISQDEGEDDVPPQGYNTRSRTMNIFQEAMLACVDISKPTYVVSQDLGMLNHTETKKPVFEIAAKQLSSRRIPMTWLCEMANCVLGEKGELLEYRHLINNPKKPQDKSSLGTLVRK